MTTYLEPWFTATSPLAAPKTDLKLLQDILRYGRISEKVKDLALKGFRNHLWYLHEETVAFGFFDPCLPLETKREMVRKLYCPSRTNTQWKRYTLPKSDNCEQLANVGLPFFVSTSTVNFFKKLGLNTDFLDVDPFDWHSNESYISTLNVVSGLQVVNDVAERAVALVKEYNCGLTRNETDYQNLLLVSFRRNVSKNSLFV